jgi:hypothetical protein
MPFVQQEDIGGVGQDRQISILTTANIGGGAIVALVTWQATGLIGITGSWLSGLWLVQTVLILLGAVAGVVLTTRWGGLSLLDRIQLRIGYQMRQVAGDHILTPEAPTSSPDQSGMLTLYREGRVVARPYHPSSEDV